MGIEAEVGLDKAGMARTYFIRGDNSGIFRVGLKRIGPDGYWEFIPRAYLPGDPQIRGLIQLPDVHKVVLRTPKWVLRLK